MQGSATLKEIKSKNENARGASREKNRKIRETLDKFSPELQRSIERSNF